MHFRLNYNTDNLSLVLSYYRIYWVLCDGGEPNRSFVKLLDSKVKQRKYNEIRSK